MKVAAPVVLDLEHLDHVVKHFMRHDYFIFDVETIGPYSGTPVRNDVVWLGLSTTGMDVSIPMGHPIGDRIIGEAKEPRADKNGKVKNYTVPVWEEPPAQLRRSVVFERLEKLLFSDREKVAHSITFDGGSLAKYYDNRIVPGPYHCTLVSSWLLDENRLNGLKPLTEALYGVKYDEGGTGKKIATTAFSKAALYNMRDVRFTKFRRHRNIQGIAEQRLERVFALEMDVVPVLMKMHREGAHLDMAALLALRDHLEELLVAQEADVYRAAGQEFNIGSTQQLGAIVYGSAADGGQALKPLALTEGGKKAKKRGEKLSITHYSTDADALAKYRGNPVVDAVLTHRDTGKLLSTYVYGYLGDPEHKPKAKKRPCQIHKGRIHTTFKQYGTVTGRFSSAEPNLQNIPRPDTDLGKRVRGLFVAPDGYKLIVADYSQIELVVLAHFAGPGALFQGFLDGIDPHTVTAAGILKKPAADVTSPERNDFGKRINFLIGYGGQEHLLSQTAEISLNEASDIIRDHKRAFPEIYAYKNKLIATARSRTPPHIRTLTGRIRRIPDLNSRSQYWRSKAERQIVNSHIQGSAADLIKIAMVRADEMLPQESKLILTVHDELVTLVPDHLVDESTEAIREAMLGEGIQKLLSVPLSSDIKTVTRWADAK